MRQVTLTVHETLPSELNFGELALLREKTYQLGDSGKVKERDQYLEKLPRTFRFTLDSFSKVFGSVFVVDASSSGYDCFQELVVVRNRLMHPKGETDLSVTDDEILKIGKAWVWYPKQIQDVLKSSIEAFDSKVVAMERAFKQAPAQNG